MTIFDEKGRERVASEISQGGNDAVVTDHGALQVTFPAEGKSAFGELLTADSNAVAQISFTYGVNTDYVEVRDNQSGSVTVADRQGVLSTGAATNSSAEIRSTRVLKYHPGVGASARFTAVFSTGTANSTQMIGIGTESDGLFFGFNGTSFGICQRKGGSPEIRTLTVTTASSTTENITITLDGVAKSVAVTNSGVITTTVNEIAASDYTDTGRGWRAYPEGNKVVFKSWDAAVHTGTYSLSGASTAVGTFAQNVAGVAQTDTWTPQASWNGVDKFDGTGPTGVTLDPLKGNVFAIKYQWLGYGLITFLVEDPDDGEFHMVHGIRYANSATTPSLGDPSLFLMAQVKNTTNSTAVTLKTASMAAFYEGPWPVTGVRKGVRNTKTNVTTSLLPILSVRENVHFSSRAVQTFARVIRAAMAVEHTKPVTIVMYRNATLTGASWTSVGSTTSLQYDTSATAISGGEEMFAVPMGRTGQQYISFVDDQLSNIIIPGDYITFAAIANSGTNAEVSVAVKVLERL